MKFLPSKNISPLVGLIRSLQSFRKVLFPLPDGPTTEIKSPSSTLTDTSFRISLSAAEKQRAEIPVMTLCSPVHSFCKKLSAQFQKSLDVKVISRENRNIFSENASRISLMRHRNKPCAALSEGVLVKRIAYNSL